MSEQPTVWVQVAWHSQNRLYVREDKPPGELGWRLEQVPLFGPRLDAHAYVVVVQYSTGDTFDNASGLRTAAAVTSTPERAVELRDLILANDKLDKPKYTVVYDGVELYCGTWTGYFESIEDVSIELVEVTGR